MMANKRLIYVFTILFFAAAGASAQKEYQLLIHLPREIAVDSNAVTLGQISVISGKEELVNKANTIVLGTIATPGQSLIFDRTLILSRLASNGIKGSKVGFSGANEITIKGKYQVVTSEEIVESARTFLAMSLPSGAICQSSPVKVPQQYIAPAGSSKPVFIPSLMKNNVSNMISVQINFMNGQQQMGTREVTFRLKYRSHDVIATKEIAAGETLSCDNIKVTDSISDEPEAANWGPPYGLTAKKRLHFNTVIMPEMMTAAQEELAIEKNKNVVIRIDNPILTITATGKALQNGKTGECIKY
jgi:flagella basal body P-ring formation protein FlgA